MVHNRSLLLVELLNKGSRSIVDPEARRCRVELIDGEPPSAPRSRSRRLGDPQRVAEVRVALKEAQRGHLIGVYPCVAQDVESIADVDHVDQPVPDDGEAPHYYPV